MHEGKHLRFGWMLSFKWDKRLLTPAQVSNRSGWNAGSQGGKTVNHDKILLNRSLLEIVDNQLKGHDPAFVTEVYQAIQRKGHFRKQAKTMIASVLLEEIYHTIKGNQHDEKRYEAALRKFSRTVTPMTSIANISLDVEEEIKGVCDEISDSMMDGDEEDAAVSFLVIWPKIKEYVIDNLYRDTADGVEKPALPDVAPMTEYEVNLDSFLLEMGTVLCNVGRYDEAIQFSQEMLDLFSWGEGEADSCKDDIGQALADSGRLAESDRWYEEWLREEPDNGNCVNGYAFCHQIRGDIEGALKIVEAHLPKDEPAEFRYFNLYTRAESLYRETGDEERAEHYQALAGQSDDVSMEQMDDFPGMWGDFDEEDWTPKPVVKDKKIYPNDPCPCGSGKKYKKCCGR